MVDLMESWGKGSWGKGSWETCVVCFESSGRLSENARPMVLDIVSLSMAGLVGVTGCLVMYVISARRDHPLYRRQNALVVETPKGRKRKQ